MLQADISLRVAVNPPIARAIDGRDARHKFGNKLCPLYVSWLAVSGRPLSILGIVSNKGILNGIPGFRARHRNNWQRRRRRVRRGGRSRRRSRGRGRGRGRGVTHLPVIAHTIFVCHDVWLAFLQTIITQVASPESGVVGDPFLRRIFINILRAPDSDYTVHSNGVLRTGRADIADSYYPVTEGVRSLELLLDLGAEIEARNN